MKILDLYMRGIFHSVNFRKLHIYTIQTINYKIIKSPVTIFNNILSQEVLDKIQQYLPVNENISNALATYYEKLYDKKVIDDDGAFEIHIYTN